MKTVRGLLAPGSAAALATLLVLTAAAPERAMSAPAARTCSAGTMPGGEWTAYGGDPGNSRTQPRESGLTPARAGALLPAWVFDTGHSAEVVGLADINGTPVVSRGCVYIGNSLGEVIALDAGGGDPVWRTRVLDLPAAATGGRVGAVVGTVAVAAGRVIVAVNQTGGPHLVALDAGTGARLWKSPPVDSSPRAYTHGSPVVHRGTAFLGFSGQEGVSTARGGYGLVDTATGKLLAAGYTVPDADHRKGFAGGGIWSTPAIDTGSGYAFVGTGNPYSKRIEHERTNAIMKIDLNRSRSTFGTVVASYKGEIDQYHPLVRDVAGPTCDLAPEGPAIPDFPEFLPPLQEARNSVGCLQMDLGFGAAPNLFRGTDGELLVGGLHKSGYYHVASAATMEPRRRVLLGVACLVCNAASTAYDATRGAVFANVAPGTTMVSFSPVGGERNWTSLVGDAVHYQPVAAAGGVVYTVDSFGFLNGYAADTGSQVLRRSVIADGATDAVAAFAGNGVSIANHTVYVAAGSRIIAYRPARPAP